MLYVSTREHRGHVAHQGAVHRGRLLGGAGGEHHADEGQEEEDGARHPAGRVASCARGLHVVGTPRSTGTPRGAGAPPPTGSSSARRPSAGSAGPGSSGPGPGPGPVTMVEGAETASVARRRDPGTRARKPTQPDQQAAGPQPGQQWLDDDPDGDRAGGQVGDGRAPRRGAQAADLVEGEVDVPQGPRVDGRRPDRGQRPPEAGGGRGEHATTIHLHQRLDRLLGRES